MKIKPLWLVIFALLLGSACESKPTRQEPVTPDGKPTKNSVRSRTAEVEIEIDKAPGNKADFEREVMVDKGLQKCLRDGILLSGEQFSVVLTGQIDSSGKVAKSEVEHSNESVKGCIKQGLSQLKLPLKAAGPFKARISRVIDGNAKSKTFLLDLSEAKKFE